MADNGRDESGSKAAPRSRAPEFTPAEALRIPDGPATPATAAAQPKRRATRRPIAARAVRSARKTSARKSAAGTKARRAKAKRASRALATEMPVKIAAPEERSDYVVSVNNKTGLVVKIERLIGARAERKPLSQPEYARVAAQLGTAAHPLAAALTAQAVAAVPPALNAPAFNVLAAKAAAVPPALTQLARSATASGAKSGAAKRAAPAPTGPGVAGNADATAVVQAYFQGVRDYLNALAAAR